MDSTTLVYLILGGILVLPTILIFLVILVAILKGYDIRA